MVQCHVPCNAKGKAGNLNTCVPDLWTYSTKAIGLVMDFIHRLVCGGQKIQRFGDWICLRPQVDGAG
jgi:hypothetical protein